MGHSIDNGKKAPCRIARRVPWRPRTAAEETPEKLRLGPRKGSEFKIKEIKIKRSSRERRSKEDEQQQRSGPSSLIRLHPRQRRQGQCV